MATVLTAAVSVLLAYLTLVGARYTAARAKEGVEVTAGVQAQDSALKAWDSLLQPYRDEVRMLRADQQAERERSFNAQQKTDAEILALREKVLALSGELGEWKRVARVIAKWAIPMRDRLLRLGEEIDPAPEELLTLQAIEDMHAED